MYTKENTVVVIPSIRQITLDYLEPLGDLPVFVVDDANGAVVCRREDGQEVLWPLNFTRLLRADVPKELREIVPEKNPSCKNLGLYLAWREGYKYVFLLDDDCDCRITPDFLNRVPIGRQADGVDVFTPSGWVNTLSLMSHSDGLFARGYPYEHRGERHETAWAGNREVPAFNEGLWAGTPDINGMDKLARKNEGVELDGRRLAYPYRLHLQRGQQLPLSIMNVQLETKLVPAFYQPPDWQMPNGFRIRRHDDVWSMYFLKACMDLKGDTVSVGGPLIWHRKAGDMVKEAVSEHYTNLVQPYVQAAIDEAKNRLNDIATSEMDYPELAKAMAFNAFAAVQHGRVPVPELYKPVVLDYTKRAARWARVFEGLRKLEVGR